MFKLVDGPAWAYAKAHVRASDRCEAYLSVQCQATGTAPNALKKKLAYNQILTAKYNGHGCFTFEAYVYCHQKPHNILADLEEPVPETKKVTDFMCGISNPTLATGKVVVNGDALKISNFEACQQYFCTLVEVAKTAPGDGAQEDRCKISLVKHGRTQNHQPKQKKPCIHAGHYEMKEWNDLIEDKKAQVQKLCKEKKAKCKVAEISTSDEQEVFFDTEGHKLNTVVTYEPSALANPYEHPITNIPVNPGTTMNNDILMINDDDEPPTTT